MESQNDFETIRNLAIFDNKYDKQPIEITDAALLRVLFDVSMMNDYFVNIFILN